MEDYERLGAFYLGRLYDPDRRVVEDELLLYDSRDLTTHAVCVGMTGSGKTGLCVGLLEEAAIDGIPAIVIDPKGDLGNLLLTFPDLAPSDFRPWIDEADAAARGEDPAACAARVSALWKKGLAEWGQDGRRIERLRAAAEVSIYTPGSNAGLPLAVLRSFAAPPPAVIDDSDAFRERIAASASGLLALLGIAGDPLRSREHILLSNLFHRAWSEGRDLDLGGLIREIQAPPFDRIGVMDLETFYPARDRSGLAMSLNNLLASPGFAAWMEGDPLDVGRLLWTPEGRPRISILSIAHLPDAERMFFVTLLLEEVLAWMRGQSGTTSLRALLYMDEVFGYFPPSAEPPSKRPMLTLLKQARAYGLGVVLATQNPVDLDYKGLSNAGTWFLGRLQTERDKARVLDGLEGASVASGASFDRGRIEAILSGLKSRVFLMNNVHEDGPVLFHARWALSYLRGPLTRNQIRTLMADRRAGEAGAGQPARRVAAAATASGPVTEEQERPIVAAGVPECFLAADVPLRSDESLVYRPVLLGSAKLHYARARPEVDIWKTTTWTAPLDEKSEGDPWGRGQAVEEGEPDLMDHGEETARFARLPVTAARAKSYARWSKALVAHLYREEPLLLRRCRQPKLVSRPGEPEGEFVARLAQRRREERDLAVAKLQKSITPKLVRLRERIRKAQQRVDREKSQYGQQKVQTAISLGATILGSLFGRKLASRRNVGRAATTARGVGRAAREKADIARAREDLIEARQKLEEMERAFREKSVAIQAQFSSGEPEIEIVRIAPRKADTAVTRLALVWTPWRVDRDGIAEPASSR